MASCIGAMRRWLHLCAFACLVQMVWGGPVPLVPALNCASGCASPHGHARGGNLTLTVIEATGLDDTDGWGPLAGLPDPFVRVEMPGVVRESEPVSDSSSPVWPQGGAKLWLGAQISGTTIDLSVWDFDEGLEFGSDFLAETQVRVIDCACFTNDEFDNATCTKQLCEEEAWVPLRQGANCGGRGSWPWSNTSDPAAQCLRIRMSIVPHIVDINQSYRPMSVTTAGVKYQGGNPVGGTLWGRMYEGNSDLLDTSISLEEIQGGMIVRTGAMDGNLEFPGPYATIQSNLDINVHVFRAEEDYDSATPGWLLDAAVWSPSKLRVMALGTVFESRSTFLPADTPLQLGYAAASMQLSAGIDTGYENKFMYIVVVSMRSHVDQPERPYRTEFDRDAFWPIMIEMIVLTLPFALIQLKFMRRIGWRMDRIESGLLQGAAKSESDNLITLVFKPIYQNGSKANIDFRRNLYFCTLGARILLCVPLALCFSHSLALAFLSVPSTAGLAVFVIGIGVTSVAYSFATWERSGWRMSRARLFGFGFGFASVYTFLLLSVVYDMRVIDAGMPLSIFSLTCVAFTLNSLPMIAVFFLDNEQLHQAFSQMQRVVNRHQKLANIKNKFQAFGTMGLKMALLGNKAQTQAREANETKAKQRGGAAFGSLLGSIFTVDDQVSAFRYTDTFRRWFASGKKNKRKLVKRAYGLSLLILLAYSIVVALECDTRFQGQGFALSFNVIVLDVALFALLRGPCAWSTGTYVSLTFGGRALLAFFAGENWLVGVGLAYLLYGLMLGIEIVNQRMQTFSSDRAGAIAYFGLGVGRKKRRNDVSAMPEFVLSVLSFFFLVALLAYVFVVPGDDIPAVHVVGQDWKVWIFGVAAFVVVSVSVVLSLAKRAMMLERQNLMRTKAYLYKKWFTLPLQLVALAELLVVMSGLLVYALTGSTFVFVSSVFWPLIFGCCLQIYSHWVSNDFHLFEPAKRRGDNPDEESDSEDDDGWGLDDDDDDEEDNEEEGDGKNGAKKKKDEEDSEDEGDSDADSEDGLLATTKQSLVASLGTINQKIASQAGQAKGRIGMPKVAFRKPINVAQKVDRKFVDDSDEEEEEEEEKKEEAQVPEGTENKDEPVDGAEKGVAEEEKKPFLEEEQEVEGQQQQQQNLTEAQCKRQAKRERKLRLRSKLTSSAPSKMVAKFRELKTRLRQKLMCSPKQMALKRWNQCKDKQRPKILRFFRISDETDPVKMTDLEAFYHGKLTAVDYSMLRALAIASVLVLAYGLVLTATEASWAHSVWYLFFFFLFSFLPVRKYYGTQEITQDMIRCFATSILFEFVGAIILFVNVIGYSMTHPVTLWLLLSLGLWPALLATVVILLIWRDSDWKLSENMERVLWVCFRLYLVASITGFFFAGPKVGFLISATTAALIVGVKLVHEWANNAFYLPLRYQYLLYTGLNVAAAFFFFLSFVLTNNEGVFFCMSVAFLSLIGRLTAQLLAYNATISKSTPLYFSTFIFPVYSLDPVTNDLVDQSAFGVLMYQIQFLLLLWGVSCIVFVDPLDVGVGIVSAAFISMITLSSYLVSRTPLWMASATLCLDEKEIKETAKQAREVFEQRRKNLEITCEEYEKRDQEDAKLDKYSAWRTKRSKLIEFEKRYTAREMVDVMRKAEEKLVLDRLGKPRRDRVLNFSMSLRDAFWTGKGPLAPFALGGALAALYHAYKDPAKLRGKKKTGNKKRGKNSAKVHVDDAALTGKMVLDGPVDFDDSEDENEEFDQLDRLIDELGPGGDILKITVKDWDLTSANDDLGFVEIELDELEPDELHIGWYDLETDPKYEGKEKMQATGKIQVQVELANVFGGEGDEPLQVRVCILRGRGLRAADSGGTSDPFCIVECGTFTRRTAVAFKTLDPEWTETRGGGRMTFPPTDDTLQIEIRDKDLLTSDFLGGVDVYLPDIPAGEETVLSYDLEGGYGKSRATGSVKLALFLSKQVDEYGLKASKSSLQVTVISAKGLRAADRGGTSDPFCVVKCGLDAFSTSVINKTLTPKWMESYTFNGDPDKKSQDDDDAVERVELLDCWKVYQQLPKLDAAFAKEYYEEMRANALFQMLLVVASQGRKSKEAILFQRFLREYRFKLLANKIEPPRNIFRSKSWATVDVGLVALWLLRLTPEQRERFYALKSVFVKEVERVEERRMQEDKQLAEHARTLDEWQRQHDWKNGHKQLADFRERKQRRERAGTAKTEDEPEIVINAREMLHELVQGPNVKTVKLGPETGAKGPLRMFQDPEFLAAKESVTGIYNEYMVDGWKLARQFNGAVELFSGGTDPDDVAQGVLHNGWFLSALVILSASGSVGDEEVDPLIDNLFITKSRNDLGAYAVRLYKNSQWELVIVDESFPALTERFSSESNGGVACSHSLKFEEMWVSVLEKAYAKYYGTYSMLENGYVHHALKTLTGYDSEQIFLLEATQGPARLRLWEKLLRYRRNGFLMGCGTIANDAANAELLDSGLTFGACYAIFQVRQVDGHRLIQLRNPPGATGEWKGDWGDTSNLWTTRLKKKLGWTDDEEDGTFWMSFADFCLSFSCLYVCHYYDPAIWRHTTLRGIWDRDLGTAAGLPNKHNPDCKLYHNPQWALNVERPMDVHIKLSQTLPDGSMVSDPQAVCAMLLRTDASRLRHTRRARFISRGNLVAWTGAPDRGYEKHIIAHLDPGIYVLLAATYSNDGEGPFSLHIDSSFELQVKQLYPRPDEDEPEIVKTELETKPVEEPKTRIGKAKAKVRARVDKAFAWAHDKKDKAELFVEQKVQQLEEKMIKHLGLDIDAVLDVVRLDDDSDDEDEEHPEAKRGEQTDNRFVAKDVTADIADIMGNGGTDKNQEKEDDDQQQQQQPQQLQRNSEWAKQYDAVSGQYYYWNTRTNVTQWEEPADFYGGTRSPELESATKIQAIFRGKQSRRALFGSSP